jgi:hypothetical protein
MNEWLSTILNELRQVLESIYGERLKQVILMGRKLAAMLSLGQTSMCSSFSMAR